MLEATFSVLKPNDNGPEFYKSFYRIYSLIQINDIVISSLMNKVDKKDQAEIISSIINNEGFDAECASVYLTGAGLVNPGVEERKKGNRGLDFSIFSDLVKKRKDPLEWYIQLNEFMNIYAACEQGIKDYLVENGFNPASVKEKTIIDDFFKIIGKKKKRFLSDIRTATADILETQNEIIAVWRYFTEIRNLYAHSGGRLTGRFRDKMLDMKNKLGKNLVKLEEKPSLGFAESVFEIDILFCFDFDSDIIYSMELHKMNFFRNFVIVLMESLSHVDDNTVGVK